MAETGPVGPSSGEALVALAEMREAKARLAGRVTRTPVVPLDGSGMWVKAESLQPGGSFKLRGAFNTLLGLTDAERVRGVVAHSSGNHAIAVALAGASLGVPVTVVMPRDAPAVKIERTRNAGADVVLVGPASSERVARAAELVAERDAVLVEPYDADAVIAATGTISLEIVEDLGGAPLELYVPISGGGLAAGVAAGAKQLDAAIRIVGVEPALAADAAASLAAGAIVEFSAEQMARTMADGLRVQRVGRRPWPHLRAYLDEVVTVSEDEIAAAVRTVATQARLVAEPSGAVSVAAALAGRGGAGAPASRRVAILTGGNVDPALFAELVA